MFAKVQRSAYPMGPGRVITPKQSLPALCCCVFLVAGCGTRSNADNPTATGEPPAAVVQVVIAEARTIADTTEYLAMLKSRHSATINPQVEGQVTAIYVKSGDQVKAGAPLLQIDPMKQEATVHSQDAVRAAQEANVRFTKITLERSQKLYDAGVISKQDLDNAQTAYDAAVAQLKSLEHQLQQQTVELHYYKVSAPMNGVVGDIPVRVGDRVAVTTLLTTVDEPGALEAYIYVPAARSRDLRLALPVRVVDENGVTLAETRVTFVSPQVDSETQTVLAKAILESPKTKFRVAQQVRTQITWGVHEGPVVPVLAVQRINGQFFAFVAEKSAKGTVARQRPLKLGDIVENEYAVLDGIHAGDHLIVSGLQFLEDGAPVIEQVQERKTSSGGQPAPNRTAN